MKKTIITALALVFVTASLVAQDDKKQEPKKKEESKSESSPPGGTRMAINEKGLPRKKQTNTDANKTSASEGKKEEPKK